MSSYIIVAEKNDCTLRAEFTVEEWGEQKILQIKMPEVNINYDFQAKDIKFSSGRWSRDVHNNINLIESLSKIMSGKYIDDSQFKGYLISFDWVIKFEKM